MYHPTTRLLAVLELLQSRGRVGGAELARRLEVDERTVRRYITMLRELGIPVEGERGRYGTYRLRAGYKLPPLMFTDDESLAIVLGLLAARQMGLHAGGHRHRGRTGKDRTGAAGPAPGPRPGRVRRADARLADHLAHAGQRGRPDREPRRPRATNGLDALPVGLAEDSETERLFDPYGVVYRAGRWYAVGHCHLRDDTRAVPPGPRR